MPAGLAIPTAKSKVDDVMLFTSDGPWQYHYVLPIVGHVEVASGSDASEGAMYIEVGPVMMANG